MIRTVRTGQVTYAVRDTHIDDKEIRQGDIMAVGDSGILGSGTGYPDRIYGDGGCHDEG